MQDICFLSSSFSSLIWELSPSGIFLRRRNDNTAEDINSPRRIAPKTPAPEGVTNPFSKVDGFAMRSSHIHRLNYDLQKKANREKKHGK
jgi:hypothetical protein